MLSRHCAIASSHVLRNARQPRSLLIGESLFEPASILKPFRAWAQLWDSQQSALEISSHDRMRVWKSYYDTLSILVQANVSSPVFDSRLQPGIELKRVEGIYQAILMRENNFPRADQLTPEIESWADQIMVNWRTLHDSAWTDEDLRPGGKLAMGRELLDVSQKASITLFLTVEIVNEIIRDFITQQAEVSIQPES